MLRGESRCAKRTMNPFKMWFTLRTVKVPQGGRGSEFEAFSTTEGVFSLVIVRFPVTIGEVFALQFEVHLRELLVVVIQALMDGLEHLDFSL